MSSRFRMPENQPAFCATYLSARWRRRRAASGRCRFPSEDAAVQAGQHLLRHPPRAVRRRQGPDAIRQRRLQRRHRLDQYPHPRRDRRRSGGAGLVPRLSRSRSGREGQPFRGSSDCRERDLQRHRPPERRQRLGRCARPDAGQHFRIDPEDLRRRGLRAAVRSRGRHRRLHAPGHRCRLERRDLDGAGEQRTPRQLRLPQVQGPVARAVCHQRSALPRRLDASSGARPAVQERPRGRGRGLSGPQLRRLFRHVRARRERAVRQRHQLGFAAGAPAGRDLAGASCAVPAGVLLTRHGRPHRRPEGRLEGPRHLRGLRTECDLAHRGRPRHAQRGHQVPVRPDRLAK